MFKAMVVVFLAWIVLLFTGAMVAMGLGHYGLAIGLSISMFVSCLVFLIGGITLA